MRPSTIAAGALAGILTVAGCATPEAHPVPPVPAESISVAGWRADLARAGVTTRQTDAELLEFGRRMCAAPGEQLVGAYLILAGNEPAQDGLYVAVQRTCPARAGELEAYRTT